MILQQLTIHNIASIEKATIDFEAKPLSDSEVFLITGKTGAGKSTILDAICLALYANTPRLENSEMQGDTKDQDSPIKITDPVQLMRRNTSEAASKLTFVGSNGVHYEAIWSVTRAHKKVTGKIQRKNWTLHNLDTGFTYTKDKEIKAEIANAIGLDFKQFCRTTLLAQGEFTKFLNSRDDEKAEILEKITGVDAYSKIGKKIYEMTSEKERIWKEAQQKTAGITLLSEEEMTEKNTELKTLDKQDKDLKANVEKSQKQLNWIKDEKELGLRRSQAKAELEKAQATINNDQTKTNERLITLWNKTIDARTWLHDADVKANNITQQENQLSSLSNRFHLLQEAMLFEQQNEESIHLQVKQIGAFIEAQLPKVKWYENAQTIHSLMHIIEDGRKKSVAYQKEITSLSQQLKEVFTPQLEQAQATLISQQQSLTQQEGILRQANEELTTINLSSLRQQNDQQKSLSNQIDIALSQLTILQEERNRYEQAQANFIALAETIKEKKNLYDTIIRLVHDTEIEKNTAKAIYEKQRESVNKWAKSIRMKLTIGDVCPVCQQKITEALPHEENIDALVATAEEEAKKAEEKYEKVVADKNAVEASITALSRQYTNDATAISKGQELLAKAQANLNAAVEACHLPNLSKDSDIASCLDKAKRNVLVQINTLSEQISNGEKKELQAKKLLQQTETLRKQVEKAMEKVVEADKQNTSCKYKINNTQTLLTTKENEVKEAENKAEQLIGSTEWSSCPIDYAQQLLQAATYYHQQLDKKSQLEKELERYKSDNGHTSALMQNILQMMPTWSSPSQAMTPRPIIGLIEKATQLQKEVASALSQLKSAKEELEENQKNLNEFLQQQPELTLSILRELNAYSQTTIANMTQALTNAKQVLSNKEILYKQAAEAYQSHMEKAVEIRLSSVDLENITETASALARHQIELNTLQQELNNKRGGIMRDIEINQANQQKIGELKKEEETQKAEYDKWYRLNQLLGDATGNKFRRIAQSYVLASLIHSANSYMRTLSNRYVLKVVPGTFVITMEDAYQGYVSRAASTLSGGESFLVSLSLALALSDIGKQLSVDTLFIDEGFGTLSGEPLQNAINTLRNLHTKSGRHVGIISHVEELKERIPVQIRVNQEGNNSSSTIEVIA